MHWFILLIETSLLAAGCKIFPIQSCYWWKGAIAREGEFVSIIQTSLSVWTLLKAEVEKHHPYEVPCIIKTEAYANDSYEKWAEEVTITNVKS